MSYSFEQQQKRHGELNVLHINIMQCKDIWEELGDLRYHNA